MTFALFSYVADLSTGISLASFVLFIVFGITGGLFFLYWVDQYDKTTESSASIVNYSKKCAMISFTAIFLFIAMPSAKTINIAQVEWLASRPIVVKTFIKIANWFDSSFLPEFKEMEIKK